MNKELFIHNNNILGFSQIIIIEIKLS